MDSVGVSTPGTGPTGTMTTSTGSPLVTVSGAGVPPSKLQDVMAAVLAGLISLVVMTCYVVAVVKTEGKDRELLLFGFSLIGTVTGYYFGRSPADRAIATAQSAADKAAQIANETAAVATQTARSLANAQVEVERTRSRAREALREALDLMPVSSATRSTGGEGADHAREVIRSAIRSLS